MISVDGILYIEPRQLPATAEPLIDHLTRKMTAAWRRADASSRGPSSRGFHACVCDAASANYDATLNTGEQTNSLCIHYLAYHRDEVPAGQLAKVAMLTDGEEEPTRRELRGWQGLAPDEGRAPIRVRSDGGPASTLSAQPGEWTDQEKAELLDFLRYFVVPQLQGRDLAHHLRTRYPTLRLFAAPRPHEPGPDESAMREAAGMPYDPNSDAAWRLALGLEP